MIQRTLDAKKPIILCDRREKDVIENLKKMEAVVKVTNLEIGDFVCSDRVVVERKSYRDFLSSIVDGRIFEQAESMKESYRKPFIIIEGYAEGNVSENSVKAAIASLAIRFEVSLISTRNPRDTALTIFWIAKKEQSELGRKLGFRKKIRKKGNEREKIVSSLPGISTKLAKRLLEKFGSVEKVFTASETELKKVRGIGEITARKIRRLLSEKY